MDLYNRQKYVLGLLPQPELDALIDSLMPGLVGTSVWQLVHGLLIIDRNKRLSAAQVVKWELHANQH